MPIGLGLTDSWGHQVAYDLPVGKKGKKTRPRAKYEFFAVFKDGSSDFSKMAAFGQLGR